MATTTTYYNLIKPAIGESASIAPINSNMDTIDEVLYYTQNNIAPLYDATTTSSNAYNTGDIVIYNKALYKCIDDEVYGEWDSEKWETTTIADLLTIPSAPDTDGTYILQLTISSGVPTYSWVSEV